MKKQTEFLSDLPVDSDAFGPHAKIAEEITSIVTSDSITRARRPHSIALLGNWGSGKSSVVAMLRSALEGSKQARVFVYDAWAHEGDGLRRAFLDDLNRAFPSFDDDNAVQKTHSGIWDQTEETTTTSEPIVRPHGRAIFLALLMTPVGIALFGKYPSDWVPIYGALWSLLMGMLAAAPLIVLLYFLLMRSIGSVEDNLKRFGVDNEEELTKLRLLSVFINKTSGVIERKHKTTPRDSIEKFRESFEQLCKRGTSNGQRLLIVVDNIDRLGSNDARAFWSTMQAFFDRTGWLNRSAMSDVWLVVPFSLQAVDHVFPGMADGNPGAAQSFVDKTFDLSFHVPVPILVHLRSYMIGQLVAAFPFHEMRVLQAVRDLFDRDRALHHPLGSAGDTESTRKTPREIKLFVNQLVALYRVASEDVALESMAAYLLRKSKIEDQGLHDAGQFDSYQRALLPRQPDVVQQMAAVHFGVDLGVAAQVVLAPLLQKAVDAENASTLKALSTRSGFTDVLEVVISGTKDDVHTVLKLSSLINTIGLEDSNLSLRSVWLRLLRKLEDAPSLGGVDESAIDGLAILAANLSPTETAALVGYCSRALSRRWIPSAGDGSSVAKSWAIIASAIEVLRGPDDATEIEVPEQEKFVALVVDQLSVASVGGNVARRLRTRGPVPNFLATVLEWPGPGEGPVAPKRFYSTARVVRGLDANWSTGLTSQLIERISKGIKPSALPWDIEMLVALASIGQRGAAAGIKQLIEGGSLSLALSQIDQHSRAFGASLAAMVLFAPDLTPQALAGKGRPAQASIVNLLAGEADSDVLRSAADTIRQSDYQDWALYHLATKSSLEKVRASLSTEIVKAAVIFRPTLSQFIGTAPYVVNELSVATSNKYLQNIGNKDIISKSFMKTPISIENIFACYQFVGVTLKWTSRALSRRIIKFLRSQTAEQWAATIVVDDVGLLGLAADIRQRHKNFELEAEFVVSLVSAVSALSANGLISDQVRARIHTFRGLLDKTAQRSLPDALWTRLNETSAPNEVVAMIHLVGELLHEKTSVPVGTSITKSIGTMLLAPDLKAAQWLVAWIRNNRRDFSASANSAGTVRRIINAALRPGAGITSVVKTELRRARAQLPTKSPRSRGN